MGFALVIIGLLMVVTGSRGTYAQFGTQLATDVRGYAPQGIAVIAVGAIGYVSALQQISRWILAFVIIVIFLAQNKGTSGFFQQFQSALNAGPQQPAAIPQQSSGPTAANPSGAPVINLGPLGTINTNPVAPGSFADTVLNWFGAGSGALGQ